MRGMRGTLTFLLGMLLILVGCTGDLGGGGGLAPRPAIRVTVGDTVLDSGANTYPFGTVEIGSGGRTVTFTVENVGEAPLPLPSEQAITVAGSATFSLSGALPDSAIAAGASASFSVLFDPAEAGDFAATLTVHTDDADIGSFTVGVSGTAEIPAPVTTTVTVNLTNLPGTIALSSVTVTVSGADMTPVEGTFAAGGSSLELQVLPGVARSLAVLATVDPTDPNAVRAYAASGSADIGGTPQTVDLVLEISRTRMLVPDLQNNRLVQIDDLAGAGWKVVTDADLGLEGSFKPSDVDLAQDGGIFVATHVDYVTGGIVRLNDLDDRAPTLVQSNAGITALAVDRARNYLYYIRDASDFWLLYRLDLADLGVLPVNVDEAEELDLWSVWGLAVGPDGVLYVPDPANATVIVFDPSRAPGSRVVNTLNVPNSELAFDVSVQDGFLYASSPGMARVPAPQVARMDLSTGAGTAIGVLVADPALPQAGELYSPQRIVTFTGSTVAVTDEGVYYPDDYNRVVGFDDMSGAGWTAFGATGSGTGQFLLFDAMMPQ